MMDRNFVYYSSHSIVSGPAQVDVNIMMWWEEFSSCRSLFCHKLPKDFEKYTAFQ
jgi:hypothetical protein